MEGAGYYMEENTVDTVTAPEAVSAITEKDLFDRLVELLTQQEEVRQDIKQLLDDVKDQENISKEDVSAIREAASLYVKTAFYEKKEKAERVFAKYEELSGED